MATVTIRNLPEDVHDALRRRAAENRRSMEAEARDVLRLAVQPRSDAAAKARALQALQSMEPNPPRLTPAGWSDVDQFLAEKHLEALWEAERVSYEEYRTWMDWLERFEVGPEEVEAFVATRVTRD